MWNDKATKRKNLQRVYNQKITIQKKKTTYDENLTPIPKWEDVGIIYAEKSQYWGRDYYSAKAYGEENSIVFTVRKNSLIDNLNTNKNRIFYKGKEYNITKIDHMQNNSIVSKIHCLEKGIKNGSKS